MSIASIRTAECITVKCSNDETTVGQVLYQRGKLDDAVRNKLGIKAEKCRFGGINAFLLDIFRKFLLCSLSACALF